MVGVRELMQDHARLLCARPIDEMQAVRDFDVACLGRVVAVFLQPMSRDVELGAPIRPLAPLDPDPDLPESGNGRGRYSLDELSELPRQLGANLHRCVRLRQNLRAHEHREAVDRLLLVDRLRIVVRRLPERIGRYDQQSRQTGKERTPHASYSTPRARRGACSDFLCSSSSFGRPRREERLRAAFRRCAPRSGRK